MVTRKPPAPAPPRPLPAQPKIWGTVLKDLREAAEISQSELADRAVAHPSTISYLESGRTAPSRDWAELLDTALGSKGQLVTAYELIAPYLAIPHPDWDWFDEFRKAEALAERIHELQTGRISGLLQTEEYMRALFTARNWRESDEQLAERMRARLGRQNRILAAGGPMLVSLLDEGTLRRVVGSPLIMREQLAHLLELGRRPNIAVQVVPFGTGESSHMPMAGMVVLEMPNGRRRIYSESLAKGHFIEDNGQLGQFIDAYDQTRAQALTERDSAELICHLLKEFDHVSASGSVERGVGEEQPLRRQQRKLHRMGPRLRAHRRRPRA
ncbi:helix-turn-helix transcriptional regulator [Kitasatospora nipponensis]|uniref:Helix-turn-helix transcriptional regulator n=1 Tax=Kitasatospora nipponensis TaxID=258049 RepID=A0ABN1VXS7_9ACTN